MIAKEDLTLDGRVHLRPREVAKMHGVSLQLVYEEIWSGRLRASQLNGRAWIIKPADVEAWIERSSTPNTDQ
ncbi:MAG: helix-turn-helix domain-containing protein [Chloroflexota bacterium]|nr:helix-turn-helix domain-containing protein [Chloroflexota bacterium]